MFISLQKYFQGDGMESRIFKAAALGGIFLSVLSFLGNLTLELSFWAAWLPLSNVAVIGGFFFWTINSERWKIGSTIIFTYLTFVFFPAMWILNAGSYGSIPPLAIMNAVMVTLMLCGVARVIVLLGSLCLFNGLIFYEMFYPGLVNEYASIATRYFDYAFGFTVSFIGSVGTIFLILHEHQKVIAAREELLQEIEKKNDDLKEKNIQLGEAHQKLQRAYETVEQLSVVDPLTGIYNRRFLLDKLKEIMEDCKISHQPLGVIMLDLDFFKSINDTYGHGFGDEVLKTVSASIRECLRRGDILGRFGGEELLIILPLSNQNIIYEVAERIGNAVRDIIWRYPIQVTVSAGISMYHPDFTLEELLERADRNLYVAKRTGRNRVIADI